MNRERSGFAGCEARNWKWPIAAAIVVLAVSYWQFSTAQEAMSASGEIPACDQSGVTKSLKAAITGSPVGKKYNVAVFGVTFISESQSSHPEMRVCFGTIFTNSGTYEVMYVLDRLFLEAEILPNNYL